MKLGVIAAFEWLPDAFGASGVTTTPSCPIRARGEIAMFIKRGCRECVPCTPPSDGKEVDGALDGAAASSPLRDEAPAWPDDAAGAPRSDAPADADALKAAGNEAFAAARWVEAELAYGRALGLADPAALPGAFARAPPSAAAAPSRRATLLSNRAAARLARADARARLARDGALALCRAALADADAAARESPRWAKAHARRARCLLYTSPSPRD